MQATRLHGYNYLPLVATIPYSFTLSHSQFFNSPHYFTLVQQVGDTETAQQILQNSEIDPKSNDSQAFVQACAFGRHSIVKLMITDGRVDPSSWNSRFSDVPLEIVVKKGHSKVVRLLVQDERVNPGLSQEFAFNKYCITGDAESVQTMLEDGVVDPLTGAYGV